jgi:hypothetical protein
VKSQNCEKSKKTKKISLDIPASHLKLEYMTVVKEDLKLSELCSIMDKSDHPYVMYQISPNIF